MSDDIAGRAYKNVSGSPILITDVATIEIPPDGIISLVDYPILERSLHLRKFISLSYLIEDPSRGAVPGPPNTITMQSVLVPQPREMSEEEIAKIADRVARSLIPAIEGIGTVQPGASPSKERASEKPSWDADRALIIDKAIRTIGPVTERFGELPEAGSSPEIDLEQLAGGLRGIVEHADGDEDGV